MLKKILKIVGIVVIVLAVAAVAGFCYLYNNGLSGQYADGNAEAKSGQIKVACVGDSITYGHGIEDWEKNNYPAVLQKLLGDKYHVANFGSSGACVNPNGDQPYISRSVYQDSLDYDADVLIFMLGTNDSKPENWTDVDTFFAQYKELLESYLQGENPPVVYIGLCAKAYYVGETTEGLAEFDIQPEIAEQIQESLKKLPLGSQYPMQVIDVYNLTAEHPEWFAKDGIHPDNEGAKAIAELVAETIKNK